ncbi:MULTISPECIES: aromatic-ring-hydroxylating dioxygenase subunit beta [Paenibacillus]|uniref:aromatic-ring-hydroxylating dioxygenase subunit beta n=1 Tax=Paenibacillus TaxID=44249 RepID=UPI000A4F0ECF|nr:MULTISPECIES: 3-phenylpropionate/cinnamic acid dioxygenase subunit beta [Paenibacillus]
MNAQIPSETAGLFLSSDTQNEITRFLYHEAFLLDRRLYKEWLALLTDDIVYRMPQRSTRERKDGSNMTDDTAFYEEDMKSLRLRIERLGTKSAWVEDPPTRNRHFISNIFIQAGSEDTEVHVRSNFLLLRSRSDSTVNYEMFGERFDTLRKVNQEWKVCARTIYPDQAVLGVLNLTFV